MFLNEDIRHLSLYMTLLENRIFAIADESEFTACAVEIFRKQYREIEVYRQFVDALKISPAKVKHETEIPFIPIEFFKKHQLLGTAVIVDVVFSSSGTTGSATSKHFVKDVSLYEQSYQSAFEHFYGKIQDICVLALLPNYLEREGSSLIYMVDDLIKQSQHPESGFLLYEHEMLFEKLSHLKRQSQKTLLIGVTYALLDFVERYQLDFPDLMVMETGGMKGKRKELVREELHEQLCKGFGVEGIHSEYGMTELLSQAYSKGEGVFECPPWMKVLIRDINDPLDLLPEGKSGGINVIDLANINSCSFIATQDLGKCLSTKRFEVLGRFDNSDIRGCNLMVG